MDELATAVEAPAAAPRPVSWAVPGGDREWLCVMAGVTGLELLWWAATWRLGIAPLPLVGSYLMLAFAGAGVAVAIRLGLGLKPLGTAVMPVLLGTSLIAVGASAFLPIKYAIPGLVPFWLDGALAAGERAVFGADPWLILDRLFGWAARPLDWIYGSWLALQSLILFLVIAGKPSPAKSRALIAYSLSWFLLGVVAATLLSSAGPIFYDRLSGGTFYQPLEQTLRARRAWIAIAESNAMWASFASARPGLVAGISAVPSLHVAISLWIFLVARSLDRRAAALAFAYFVVMWIASVQLGWHYAVDGLAGALGMLLVWRISGAVVASSGGSSLRPASRPGA